VRTARNAGLDCIAVDWGFRDREVLEAEGATVIVSDCAALEKLLSGDSGDIISNQSQKSAQKVTKLEENKQSSDQNQPKR
ncbi:MAG: hypothetical protein PUD20_10855, partial [bacterium]|nr:hypothetical protein [bacterium]